MRFYLLWQQKCKKDIIKSKKQSYNEKENMFESTKPVFRDEHKIILNTASAIPNFYWTMAKKKKRTRRRGNSYF